MCVSLDIIVMDIATPFRFIASPLFFEGMLQSIFHLMQYHSLVSTMSASLKELLNNPAGAMHHFSIHARATARMVSASLTISAALAR